MKKKLVIALCVLPSLSWAYSYQDINKITLQMNHQEWMYDIRYEMNNGKTLVANMQTTARNEWRARNRIHNVTKNIPEFRGISKVETEALFDWQTFSSKRAHIHALVKQILPLLDRGIYQNLITIIKLQIIQDRY